MEKRTSLSVQRGFTLLEILLVVAAIAILAGIVIVAINPAKQLADTRDAQRRSDVNAISNAISQYAIKNGSYPGSINVGTECAGVNEDSSSYGICNFGVSCDGVSLDDDLSPDFLASIPRDPSVAYNANHSGYTVMRLTNDRILVCAPHTEEADDMISVTR